MRLPVAFVYIIHFFLRTNRVISRDKCAVKKIVQRNPRNARLIFS